MKIARLHLADHPFFGTTDIDFTDPEGNPLDTVVLAGINGSGKTTLLREINRTIRESAIRFSLNRFSVSITSSKTEEKNFYTCDPEHVVLFFTP